jgi:hypothetical protein
MGRPIASALLAAAMLVSGCGAQPDGAQETESATTAGRPPHGGATTSDVQADRTTDGMARLVAVRLARKDGFDRLELEFTEDVPSYRIGYRPLPAYADGSGFEIPLPGAHALMQISLIGATGSGWIDGPETYFGPSTVTADTAVVTEAKAAGDFEAVLNWVVGTRSTAPFTVEVVARPPLLVINFMH